MPRQRRGVFNPAFFLSMRKKAPLTVERKNGKGGVCVGTNFTSLTLPHAAGLVRFVVPPFPTRIASLDSRGSPAFAIPLKTTKKGTEVPFLEFPRSLVYTGAYFKLIKRDADAYWADRRVSRNTQRFGRADSTRKGIRVDVGIDSYEPHKVGKCSEFHTSNIQRARTGKH